MTTEDHIEAVARQLAVIDGEDPDGLTYLASVDADVVVWSLFWDEAERAIRAVSAVGELP